MAMTWVNKGNLKGNTGDTGETGATGAAGASMRSCSITITANSDVSVDSIQPSTGIKANDMLLDITGNVFVVASVAEGGGTVHVGEAATVNLKGAKGDTGDAGKDGTGVTILGSYDSLEDLQEAHATGEPGDSYLVDGDLYVWDSVSSQWKNVGNIKGDTGDTGAAGAGMQVGSGVPSSPAPNGTCYIDTASGNLYVYEEA